MNDHTLKVLDYFTILEKSSYYSLTEEGKKYILSQRPLTNFEKIKEALKETAEAMLFLEKGGNPLNGLKSIFESLDALSHGITLNPNQIWNISNNLKVLTKAKALFKNPEYSTIQKTLQNLVDFKSIINLIDKSIAEDGSVLDSASPELESIRKKINVLKNRLRKILEDIISQGSYRSFLQGAYITERKGRWVVPIKAENRNDFPGIIHDTSSSGSTVFMEPLQTVNLSNEITNLERKEEHEINRILRDLSDHLRTLLPSLNDSLEISLKLEAIFSRASYGFNINGSIPEITQDKKIEIIGGRHPLLTVKPVPVDIEIGTTYKTLIISGPNTGGKTVSLKIVGLFTLMTQTGFPIPAYKATLGVFSKVYADIGDEQSVTQNISTFSSHIGNISSFLPQVDESTLIILDELGAGTDPQEGSALAYALLDYFHHHSALVIVSTHHSELKTFPLKFPFSANGSMEFDLISLKPTYKLIIGVPGRSFALHIAKKLGIPADIVKKANTHMPQHQKDLSELIKNLNEIRKSYEIRKSEYENLLKDANKTKEVYEAELKELKSKKKKILNELRIEGEEKIDSMINLLKEKINQIDKKELTIKEARRAYQEIKQQSEDTLSDFNYLSLEPSTTLTLSAPTSLSVGDKVFIESLNEEGVILKPVDKKGNVMVQVGFLKTTVKLDKIKIIQGGSISKVSKKETTKFLSSEKQENIPIKLDLHGLRGEDAINLLDQYLEQAYLAGYGEVKIIHGLGKGILKKLVSEFLRKHPYVSSYYSNPEEGEGITYIRFKE